jgi:hypothetical protein
VYGCGSATGARPLERAVCCSPDQIDRVRLRQAPTMRRFFFNLLSALSFILLGLICFVWIVSHFYGMRLVRVFNPHLITVQACWGNASFSSYTRPENLGFDVRVGPFISDVERLAGPEPIDVKTQSPIFWRYPLLGYESGTTQGLFGPEHYWILIFPVWFCTIPFLLLPMRWLHLWIRHRWMTQTNVCMKCGYDLRATPDRCPECGTNTE